MEKNRITELFGIKYPVVQGGMVWCSGWRLASAVSNAGGLGLLGAGSMHPETLEEHIAKMKEATDKPWGVNVPLMYPEIDRLMKLIIDSGVKIVFTSAGSPKKFTAMLHEAGITVAHVVSSSKFARKCEEAGVDAVVAEGFEAGGHNGREETTTMTLIPQVRRATCLPLIAAGLLLRFLYRRFTDMGNRAVLPDHGTVERSAYETAGKERGRLAGIFEKRTVRYYYRKFMGLCKNKGLPVPESATSSRIQEEAKALWPEEPLEEFHAL